MHAVSLDDKHGGNQFVESRAGHIDGTSERNDQARNTVRDACSLLDAIQRYGKGGRGGASRKSCEERGIHRTEKRKGAHFSDESNQKRQTRKQKKRKT